MSNINVTEVTSEVKLHRVTGYNRDNSVNQVNLSYCDSGYLEVTDNSSTFVLDMQPLYSPNGTVIACSNHLDYTM